MLSARCEWCRCVHIGTPVSTNHASEHSVHVCLLQHRGAYNGGGVAQHGPGKRKWEAQNPNRMFWHGAFQTPPFHRFYNPGRTNGGGSAQPGPGKRKREARGWPMGALALGSGLGGGTGRMACGPEKGSPFGWLWARRSACPVCGYGCAGAGFRLVLPALNVCDA